MFAFAVTIAALLFLGNCESCYAEWVQYPWGNQLFQFNTENKTWHDAKTACEANGGYLAEPSECAVDVFLREKVKSQDKFFWIRGSDIDKEGDFKWQNSGSSLGYSNWHPRESNNHGNQDCIQYWKNGEWDDVKCGWKRGYICQKNA